MSLFHLSLTFIFITNEYAIFGSFLLMGKAHSLFYGIITICLPEMIGIGSEKVNAQTP